MCAAHKNAAPSQMLDQFSCQLPEFLSCISADTIIVIIEAIKLLNHKEMSSVTDYVNFGFQIH